MPAQNIDVIITCLDGCAPPDGCRGLVELYGVSVANLLRQIPAGEQPTTQCVRCGNWYTLAVEGQGVKVVHALAPD